MNISGQVDEPNGYETLFELLKALHPKADEYELENAALDGWSAFQAAVRDALCETSPVEPEEL